jgi:hypothetical protein
VTVTARTLDSPSGSSNSTRNTVSRANVSGFSSPEDVKSTKAREDSSSAQATSQRRGSSKRRRETRSVPIPKIQDRAMAFRNESELTVRVAARSRNQSGWVNDWTRS